MWIESAGLIFGAAVLMLLVLGLVQNLRRINAQKKARKKEETALKGVVAGISARLYDAYPNSKWKWVCRPAGFAVNGGIARIEVLSQSKQVSFMDVCLATDGYMALHLINVVEVKAAGADTGTSTDFISSGITNPPNAHCTTATPVLSATPNAGIKPYDEESVIKWYNIVLINALTALIEDLNANGEVCLYIGQDGKAHLENGGKITVVYDFGEMPDKKLWVHITEKLGTAGLFAEVQDENRIFISWA